MLYLVVVAGGKGSRLKELYKKKSKTLVPLNQSPIIDQIYKNCNKIKNKYLIINNKQKDIIKHIKKNKLKFNIIFENKPLGTGGCLYNLKKIKNYFKHDFLIIYGDLLVSFDYLKFYKFHKNKKSQITLYTKASDHAFDSDLILSDNNNKIKKIFFKPHKKNSPVGNTALTGVSLVNGCVIKNIEKNYCDFKKILNKYTKIYNYNSRELIKDIGTKKRLLECRIKYKNINFKDFLIQKKMPAVFLDRDGVINKEKKNENYSNPLNLNENVDKAIIKINKKNYLCIIITNQPAIAKGFLSENKLNIMHRKLLKFLSDKNALIHDIYYCPHHPDLGFKGEIKKYKIKCKCRKPSTELFKKAVKKYNIDLKKSIFIGNSMSDELAAKNLEISYLNIGRKKLSNDKNFLSLEKAINHFFKK